VPRPLTRSLYPYPTLFRSARAPSPFDSRPRPVRQSRRPGATRAPSSGHGARLERQRARDDPEARRAQSPLSARDDRPPERVRPHRRNLRPRSPRGDRELDPRRHRELALTRDEQACAIASRALGHPKILEAIASWIYAVAEAPP